jgi:two-component system response regulator AtoC
MFEILVIDDDEQMRFFLKEALERQQYGVTVRGTAEEGLAVLRARRPDLVLLDIRLPGMSGLQALDEILAIDNRIPIIVMTAHGTRETALEAIRRGAYDYFTKPFQVEEMEIVVRRALERRRFLGEIERLRSELSASRGRGRMVGSSPAMKEVFRLIDRVGPTDSTVLILGESGTGKELIAEALHDQSPRRDRPFVKLNCAAIPETLLESELFGHEKGAFTGALARKPGQFQMADGGTLLLDEIGDMSLTTQAKILRVLQEREVQLVGGTRTIRVDVRIIASTNRLLEQRVKEGLFRDDLYFRLNVVTIPVPPLRERREEIPDLAEHFLADANTRLGRTINRIAPNALAAMLEYTWPGNVRELKNAIERAAVVNDGDALALESLPPSIQAAAGAGGAVMEQARWAALDTLPLDDRIAQIERAFVADALARAAGVQAAAARLLGVSERSVWHLVKKHQIEVGKIKNKTGAVG